MTGSKSGSEDGDNLDDLLATRRALQSQLKRIKTAVNKHHKKEAELGQGAMRVLHEEIIKILDETKELEKSISSHVDETEFQVHELVFNDMFETITTYKGYLKTAAPLVPEGASASSSHTRVKLPQLELPTFSGNYNDWPSYQDLFTAIIHDNKGLTAAQKMQYLKSSLKGEAAGIIHSMKVTDDNYVEAWKLITARYQNKREIVHSQLKKLFSQSFIQHESPKEIKQLLDTTNECVRALKVLGLPVAEWDTILVFLISERLDPESRRRWALTLKGTELPKFKDMDEFIEQHVRGLLAADPGKSKSKPNKPALNQTGSSSKPTSTASYHVAKKYECAVCKSDHATFRCESLLANDIQARIDCVKKHNLCLNCLRGGHSYQQCKSDFTCKTCKKKHHTLLHLPTPEQSIATPQPSTSSQVTGLHVRESNPHVAVLMSTAIVKVLDSYGCLQSCRVLLDGASEASFISEKCIQRLGIDRQCKTVNVSGIGSSAAGEVRGKCDSVLYSRVNQKSVQVELLVLPRITGLLPRVPCTQTRWPHLKGLQLADPYYYEPNNIDMLLGVDVYADVMLGGKVEGVSGSPVAFKTIFGWVLSGKINANNKVSDVSSIGSYHSECNTDIILQKFWEVESLPQRTFLTKEEQLCEDFFANNHQRNPDGRFVVSLPFNNQCESLGVSRETAVRHQVERRLAKNPVQYEQYRAFMREYLTLGHMELIPDIELPKPLGQFYYIPHHHVMKESSSTTKLRVVFDASCKTSSGVSLNECQLVGPKLQDDLLPLILRFRSHIIALTADIAKMYRQILVNKSDTDFLRILWRESVHEPIKDYRLQTVTYGTSSAPYLAVKSLQQLAVYEREEFPAAAECVSNDFYVDDLMSGASSVEEALVLQQQLISLCDKGGFELRKWSSNDPTLVEAVPPEFRETNSSLDIQEDTSVKALGIQWTPTTDTFSFKVQPMAECSQPTKRIISSEIAKVFDPLGWLSPVTIRAKILLQELWRLVLKWDDILPEEVQQKWFLYRNQLDQIQTITIPRCITTTTTVHRELHGFSDASESAYSAVVYMRNTQSDGLIVVRIVAAKTKVAPIKTQSVPRLELCGALLLCRLFSTVKSALSIDCDIFGWTDSTTVLRYLAAHPNRWKTFVANRVSEIQESLPSEKWRYVPSEENPADCASRGISSSQLKDFSLWWSGPPWLSDSDFPQPQQLPISECADDERKRAVLVHQVQFSSSLLIDKVSTLTKLKRVTAYCIRFITNTRLPKGNRITSPLTSEELSTALNLWVGLVQRSSFPDEILCIKEKTVFSGKSPLKTLNPFIDKTGLLRVGGRISKSSVPEQQKHPLILPRNHKLTLLIVQHYHQTSLHAGPQLSWATIQQQFWIIRGRDTIRHFIQKCVVCKRQRAELSGQLMGSLHSARVNPGRAFQNVGVDYAGPITLRVLKGRGQKTFKGYIALFVCFATKAVHLETVSDLTTEAFLSALKRFVSRRGKPKDIYSDSGTNFVGADKELKLLLSSSQLNQTAADQLSTEGINWHFNAPYAPHQGGLWEAGVKAVKHHLRRIVGLAALNYEDLSTVLNQIESCLNSRPLCAMSPNPDDLEVLTPGHFLKEQPLNAIPEPDLTDLKENRLSRWQRAQQLAQHFWRRWSLEYLSSLQQRFKWVEKRPNVQVGDLVLIKEDNLPTLKWKRGRVVELHPGVDKCVRVVSLKTQNGVIKRPVVKLSPLLTSD